MSAMIVAVRQIATKTTQKSIAMLLSIAGLKKYINHCYKCGPPVRNLVFRVVLFWRNLNNFYMISRVKLSKFVPLVSTPESV